MTRWLGAALLAAGCGALPDHASAEPPTDFCRRYRCEAEVTTFAPSLELVVPTESILARLRVVTGRGDLRIDTAGVPIAYADDLRSSQHKTESGKSAPCGHTTYARWEGSGVATPLYTQRIQLDPTPPAGCPRIYTALMHELIHALAPGAEHIAGPSLFAETVGSADSFDEPATAALCREFACAAFAPESQRGAP